MDKNSKLSLSREESAGYLTNWAARLYAKAMDRRLRALGLSSGYLPVLFALSGGEALSQRELVEAAAVEQPTMAATLARMERDGLVGRRPHPTDKRSSLVFLTPAAEAKAEGVKAAIGAVNGESLAGLTDGEQEAVRTLLRHIIANLQAVDER